MRVALGIEYDGTDYFGWQRLAHGPTLQAEVEAALTFVADHAVTVTCAGRTDAGVHARCQVVHFDTHAPREDRKSTRLNSSHPSISYAVFCLKKKTKKRTLDFYISDRR